MNIYELEKKATPGPLQSWTCESIPGIGLTPANPPQEWCAYVEGYRHKEAAALLAHCHNNFMQALAALKRLAKAADSEYPRTDERHPDNDGTNKLIAELEEVKT